MSRVRLKLAAVFMAGVAAGLCTVAVPGGRDADAGRLQRVEDRQQIEELLAEYGATLDRHDFEAFGRLFTEDAVYGGGRGEPTRGRAAIQAALEKSIASNPAHLPAPDFHVFFNPSIRIEGDRATAQSKGAYAVPDARTPGGAQMMFFSVYDDVLVRRGGRWLFQQRTLHSTMPPAAQK